MRKLSLLWSFFNVDEEEGKNRFKPVGANNKISSNSVDVVGLSIILLQPPNEKPNLLLAKPALRLKKKPTFQTTIPSSGSCSSHSSFLESCCLCSKNLSPDKDVYMYRGDPGFCSVECRSRQIYLDERKEIEASTKRMLASFRHCSDGNGCKTCVLLEELQQRRNIKPLSNYGKNILVI